MCACANEARYELELSATVVHSGRGLRRDGIGGYRDGIKLERERWGGVAAHQGLDGHEEEVGEAAWGGGVVREVVGSRGKEDDGELGISALDRMGTESWRRLEGLGGRRGWCRSFYVGGELRLAWAVAIGSEATGRLGALTYAAAAEKRERRKGNPRARLGLYRRGTGALARSPPWPCALARQFYCERGTKREEG